MMIYIIYKGRGQIFLQTNR